MSRKLISVISPAYNEEACIAALYDRLAAASADLPSYDFEFILVDNGSADGTYAVAQSIRARDPRVKIIKLTRNFTPEGGIAAGLAAARGDAAVIMSADLEDPPELIPAFLAKWEEGFENVYGVIEKRSIRGLRSLNAKLFYRLLHGASGGLVPKDAADFRLIDRKLIDSLNRMPERGRFFRGLAAWTGYASCGVRFTRGARHGGVSKANTRTVINLALRGICSFSSAPLRLSLWLGLALALPSFLALLWLGVRMLLWGWLPLTGLFLIVGLNLFLFGLVFITMGIMGEYIGMIAGDVRGRPLYVVETHLGLGD